MIGDWYILDKDHLPRSASMEEWATWAAGEGDPRRVASDYPLAGVHVSTVFLGLDHAFGRGYPQLFETMILGGAHDGYQRRYSTWTEASAGHIEAVTTATSS